MNTLVIAFMLISLLQNNPLVPGNQRLASEKQIRSLEQTTAAENKTEESRKETKQMWVTLTAYSSDPDQTDDSPFITASGAITKDGIIAANFLNFGTKVKIPALFGDKTFIVEDRMHPRFSDRLDVWMPTREAAQQFGRQYALIEIEA